MANTQVDPSIISTIPEPLESRAESEAFSDIRSKKIIEENSELRTKIGVLEDRLERAKGETTVEAQKAKLIIPYSNKVFDFVVWFCACCGLLIVMDGVSKPGRGFELPESVLQLIAGSTIVAVVGLLATTIAGIYKS